MFYSRPDIKPLNYNLVELPVRHGSETYHAWTDQGHFMDIRFSSGWLTVWIAKQGKGPELMIGRSIAPFGITEIFPEQLCYILGLTVNDRPVSHPSDKITNFKDGAGYFDLSGKTTTWCQEILTESHFDIGTYIDELIKLFPNTLLVQTEINHYSNKERSRKIDFVMDQDNDVTIGIVNDDWDGNILVSEATNFPFSIKLHKKSHQYDIDGSIYVKSQLQRLQKDVAINFATCGGSRYRLSSVFLSDCSYSWSYMKQIQELTKQYFYDSFETYDLTNHKKVEHVNVLNVPAVSRRIMDWVEEGSNRYTYVNYNSDENPQFYGMKPIRKA